MSGGPSSNSNTMVGGGVGLGGNVGQGASAYSFYNQSKTSQNNNSFAGMNSNTYDYHNNTSSAYGLPMGNAP